jgi:drug/metabolite transporter (DMT)-like permease
MGVGWGYLLAGEKPTWNALVALTLILTGLACARWLKPRAFFADKAAGSAQKMPQPSER